MSAAVDQVTDSLAAATISDPTTTANGDGNNQQIDAVNAIVAEGRRLYIGNLAYATTEGDLNEFFKGFLV
jgi:RNA recognition motif-containing protein